MGNTKNDMIIGECTQDIDKIRQYVRNFRNRNYHSFQVGLNEAMATLEQGGGKNKIIILFSDCDSDYDSDFENSSNIAAKKAKLVEMKEKGIKLYTIYRATDSRLYIDQYSDAFIVQPQVNKDKQVEAFNNIFKDIVKDLSAKSNTVSATITTGIQGYKYAITTSSTHTFTDEPIVKLEEIPTYISGEQNMVQYLHLVAVDNAGNVSAINSQLLQVPAKITLETLYDYGMNYVPLEWTINDHRSGYVYRLYQREAGQDKFVQIPSSNSKTTLAREEKITNKFTTPITQTWTVPQGVTEITVTVAGAGGGGRRRLCSRILWIWCIRW